MNDIDNLKKYINIINYVIKKIENNVSNANDEIVKIVCLNVNENIDKIKNILSKKNLEDNSDDSDESTKNNINDSDSDCESIEDKNHNCDKNKEDIIYYQKYPIQKKKLEIFNKSIFIF